jgi:hypothetical protein
MLKFPKSLKNTLVGFKLGFPAPERETMSIAPRHAGKTFCILLYVYKSHLQIYVCYLPPEAILRWHSAKMWFLTGANVYLVPILSLQ